MPLIKALRNHSQLPAKPISAEKSGNIIIRMNCAHRCITFLIACPLWLAVANGATPGVSPLLGAAWTRSNSQVFLSWPVSAGNYTLYATTNLALTNWQLVTNVPVSSNSQFYVNLPTTNGTQQFFRLMPRPLHTSGTNIVNASGAVVQLKGLNLGGWLVMEGWMCPLDSSGNLPDTYSAITNLDHRFGVATEQSLIHAYQTNWITLNDLNNLTDAGYNCVRMPVWWGNFYSITNTTSSGWRSDAFTVLDWLVSNCAVRGIYVVIDMHGVIGGQSTSGDTGWQNQNQYWTNSLDQSQTADMWKQIATHYNSNSTVAGYDLINEPMGTPSTAAVWAAYTNLYTTIRAVDNSHMIIVEGTFGNWDWSMLPSPSIYGWTNIVYQMHEYQWGANNAAGVEAGADNQVTDFHNHLSWNVPGYIGEWNDMGMGAACYTYSINDYKTAGLSWTMWAYKAAHGSVPDGWGWFDPTTTFPPTPNLETDSTATIVNDWQQWQTTSSFSVNSAVGLGP